MICSLITELIGEGWKKDADELKKLTQFENDDAVLDRLISVKHEKKKELAAYVKRTQNIDLDTHSVFDIQADRDV